MFERFTDRARNVMALANEEAQTKGRGYIGSGQILLGLVREDTGIAAVVLARRQVDYVRLRLAMEERAEENPEEAVSGHPPRTPEAIDVIRKSLDQARRLGHDYIGTEHILLGLLKVTESTAGGMLERMGIKPEDIRREVLSLLAGGK